MEGTAVVITMERVACSVQAEKARGCAAVVVQCCVRSWLARLEVGRRMGVVVVGVGRRELG